MGVCASLDIVEPMGMETLVYLAIEGRQICGRVDRGSGAQPSRTKRLVANMNHMHLIDPASGAVL